MELFLPVALLEVQSAAVAHFYAAQFGIKGTQVDGLVQRSLGAQLIQQSRQFFKDLHTFCIIQSDFGLIDQRIHFRVVQTGLVGSIDRIRMVYAQYLAQQIAGRIAADSCLIIAFCCS